MTYTDVQTQTKFKAALGDGITLRKLGLFDKAIDHYRSIRRFFDESDPTNLRRFYSGIGVIYFNLGDYEQAILEYEQGLRLPINDSQDEIEDAALKGNIANALVELKRTAEAHAFLDHAEKVLRDRQVDDWLGDRLETRARAYFIDDEYLKALEAAKESFDLLWHCFDTESLSQAIKTLGMAFEACKRNGLFQVR